LEWAKSAFHILKNFPASPTVTVLSTNPLSKYELISKILFHHGYDPNKYLVPFKAVTPKNKILTPSPSLEYFDIDSLIEQQISFSS
jgi:hypothetical protein